MGKVGFLLILVLWTVVSLFHIISPGILPSPLSVVEAVPTLISDYDFFGNILYTISLNLSGFVIAIIAAVVMGFIIGLFPTVKGLFREFLEVLRYVALTSISGIFISIFGLGYSMKVALLAFGIFVFALPQIIDIIEDLQNPKKEDNIYLQTMTTIGVTKWQLFKYVYWPYTMDKAYEGFRELVAISYTYTIFAESINKVGGIGAMISTFLRQSRMSEIYVGIMTIILIGYLQDKLFRWLKPLIFKQYAA